MASDAATTTERELLLHLVSEVERFHYAKQRSRYVGLRDDWDGTSTGDITVAMNRVEDTVCASCGVLWPCDTIKAVRCG